VALGRNYRRLFAASTVSNLGDGIGLVAYPWLASAVTRNPVLLALVAVAFATMNVVGGYVVTDRMLQMFRKRPSPPASSSDRTEG